MMKEIWKPINGYEGLYEVSNFSRIKSLSHLRWGNNKIGKNKKNGKRFRYRTKERILKEIKSGNGYLCVNLGKMGVMRPTSIHRIVSQTFIPNPQNKPQVNHKNGIKTDNRIKNLEWVTPSEQGLHSFRVLGNKPGALGRTGSKNGKSKSVVQKTMSGRFVRKWASGRSAVIEGGFESSCITRCCQGKSKYHKGYKWQYE